MTQRTLQLAAKNYGAAAKVVAGRITSTPTAAQSEQLIGCGIASDWCRRAASLLPLTYSKAHGGRLIGKSDRAAGVTELLRFSIAWSGANAVFARPALLDVLAPPGAKLPGDELRRFRVLHAAASLSTADEAALTTTLHSLLDSPVVTRVPGVAAGTSRSTLYALHYKYTPVDAQAKGLGC